MGERGASKARNQEDRRLTRREFIGHAGATAVAVGGLAGMRGPARAVPRNDTIILGVIGCGGRGQSLINGFMRLPGCEVGAVCDVDELRCGEAQAIAGESARGYADFRELLEQDDLDAVVVATPDHWHAIMAVLACQTGLDVYVEKPLTHNIREGRAMVEAARRHDRVVCVGTQQRSGAHYAQAAEYVQSGALGAISRCEVWNVWNQSGEGPRAERGRGIGNPPDDEPPPGVDYDLWLGPAPKRPFNPNRFHWGYVYFWDYAGGMMTNWGVHHLDVVHWLTGIDTPLSAISCGGKHVMVDARDTPDTLDTLFEYPGFTVQARVYHANAQPIRGRSYGIAIYGTDGTLTIDRSGFEVRPEGSRIEPVHVDGSVLDGPHQRDFLDCLRTRRKPFADVETGHRSTIPCHLANISYRVGRKVIWNAEAETIGGDREADHLLGREYRAPWKLPSV